MTSNQARKRKLKWEKSLMKLDEKNFSKAKYKKDNALEILEDHERNTMILKFACFLKIVSILSSCIFFDFEVVFSELIEYPSTLFQLCFSVISVDRKRSLLLTNIFTRLCCSLSFTVVN